jgi:hypothetical protein
MKAVTAEMNLATATILAAFTLTMTLQRAILEVNVKANLAVTVGTIWVVIVGVNLPVTMATGLAVTAMDKHKAKHKAVPMKGTLALTPEAFTTVTPEAFMTVTPEAFMTVTPEALMAVTPEAYKAVTPEAHMTVTPEAYMAVTPEAYMAATPARSVLPATVSVTPTHPVTMLTCTSRPLAIPRATAVGRNP